jgi:hypothetical protein
MPALAFTDPSPSGNGDSRIYGQKVKEVCRSKFVIGQLVFNVVASFLGPLGTFYLLFGYLSEGPYEWSSGALLGVVLGSLVGSPILIFALMPVGLPEAVASGWFPILPQMTLVEDLQRVWWLPASMMPLFKWPWSTQRNLAIGMIVGVVYVPVALLLARYTFGPTLSTWTLIWFNVVYEVALAVPILMLGLIGYAVEENLEHTLQQMSDDPNCTRRLCRRSCMSIRMALWPV